MLNKLLIQIKQNIKIMNDSYEFKPLLSEIELSPLNPLGRFTFWTIVFLILSLFLWLIIGKVNVVVTATGIVVPDGESKVIQPFEIGVVKDILVKEGDFVKKGDTLILLDTTASDAKIRALDDNIQSSKLSAMRLNSGDDLFNVEINNTETVNNSILQTQKEIYKESISLLEKEILVQQNEIQRLNMQIGASKARKRDLEFQLDNLLEKEIKLAKVKDIIAYNEYANLIANINSMKESILQIEFEISSFIAQIKECENNILKLKSRFAVENLKELTQVQMQLNDLISQKKDAEFKNNLQKIVAPCDGYIDKLNIHTVGGIVTPAQDILSLTPSNVPFWVKINVKNNDIGFVKMGMPVSIKLDAYDFQKYGVLKGFVKSISTNSVKDDFLGFIYEVYVQLENESLLIDGNLQKITAGMTLNAEIEIGKRRIIEFFVYPIIKSIDEGVSVR